MAQIIETHAHIYDEVFQEDFEIVLNNARNANVKEIWMPNCNSETVEPMLALNTKYPDYCLPMFGLHPCYVNDDFEIELADVEVQLAKKRPIAIGEIGIDLYWDKTFFEQQKKAFTYQCELALKHNLWIDIHSRDAFVETISLIEEINNPNLKGIFHCFSGDLADAKKAIELGFLLGIGGVVTFKNGGLDKFLAEVPIESIVLETDSPYLAPVPYRGKRNEPSYLPFMAQKVADIYQIEVNDLIEQTTLNALKLKESYN